jgi:hypothetical protein
MKRNILALGLSACCLAYFAGDLQAWLFHHWKHNRYTTQITCRPYNAFTPICWGNLTCDGCCPSPCGVASGHMPLMMGAPPWACGAGPCFGGGYGHDPFMGFGGHMPMLAHPPMHGPMPPINNAPNFTPPTPTPLPQNPNNTMIPPIGVSQANFYPMPYYVPMAMPMQYNPYMGMPYAPAPGYWYGR